jgi:UDP-glucose 4-epimerase
LYYYENNITGTIVLLKAMKKAGCGLIIFSSSATVYGSGSAPPFAETAPIGVGVTNPYGWTKFMLEQVLRDTAKASKDMRVVLLRYFNPVGAHESGKIGEDPAGRPNNLMPFVLQVAIGRRDKLMVYGDDYATADGSAERDFVHVVDLAKGHLAALQAYEEGPPASGAADEAAHPRCAVLNLGTGVPCSVKQVIAGISEVTGKPLPHVIGPRREGDLGSVYADASKAEAVLGWKATKTLKDMCEDGWRWQQTNPWGYRTEEEAKTIG